MNQLLAVEFAAKYREFGAWFTEMTELTLRVDDQETAKSIRRKLAEMTMALAVRRSLLDAPHPTDRTHPRSSRAPGRYRPASRPLRR